MNESVIYLPRLDDRVLCEWRDLNGTKKNCALGGGIELGDRERGDHPLVAAIREAEEELGILVNSCQLVDKFVSEDVRFYVVQIDSWIGSIPLKNRDNHNELKWVTLNGLLSDITIEPFKHIIRKMLHLGVPSGIMTQNQSKDPAA